MEMIAWKVKDVSDKFKGEAWLYRVEPPAPYGWSGEEKTEYLVASAVSMPFGTLTPETFIFPADATGKVLDWGELPGSFRGEMDCDRAIREAGYTIVEEEL